MSPINWNGGDGDITSATNWQNGQAPQTGDTAVIGSGTAIVTAGDTIPEAVIDVGASQGTLTDSPTSILDVQGATLSSGLTIANTQSGGSIGPANSGPVIGSTLLAEGAVTSYATIDIGGGDFEAIVGNSGANSFANDGQINVNGAAANDGALYIGPSPSPNSSLTAAYGDISVTFGFVWAAAADLSAATPATITLQNASEALVTANLQHTGFAFSATGSDLLAIGQTGAGAAAYQSVGQITGFAQGDAIALLSDGTAAATPTSLQYNATTGMLTVANASNQTLATLNIGTGYATNAFALSHPFSPTANSVGTAFTSQYNITVADSWTGGGGANADILNAANWSGGAPVAGGASFGAGTMNISASDSFAGPLTINVGASAAGLFAPITSNIVAGGTLSSNLTIENEQPGGLITSSSNGPIISSAIEVVGAVTTSAATINVGGGDFEAIVGGTGNSFINAGVINADGMATNAAVLYVGVTASYGAINLNDAFLWANAANPSVSAGDVTLQNASEALVTANLQHTNFAFSATGANVLAIAQTATGAASYQAVGQITGFVAGDAIALLSDGSPAAAPNPAALQYNATTGILTVVNASNQTLATLNVGTGYAANAFSLTQAPVTANSVGTAYTAQYDITTSATAHSWTSGAIADYSTSADWSGGAPQNGDVAAIGTGAVAISANDLPASLTFEVGASQTGIFTPPSSILDLVDANLSAGVTIDNTEAGGFFAGNQNATVMGSLLLVNGAATSSATINVGAGDSEYIAMQQDVASAPGSFNNRGVINATGTQGDLAIVTLMPALTSGAGASANYGLINLNNAALSAQATDIAGTGQINIANNSLAIVTADLQYTNATFADGTGRLDIGQNAGGVVGGAGTAAEYAFGGQISGFQAGDVIGLMQSGTAATPASLSYNSTSGVLTILDASNNVLGALKISTAAANPTFVLTKQSGSADFPGYSGQYAITLADVWGGTTGDFNLASNWVGGVLPTTGATINSGQATLSAGEYVAPMTIKLGAKTSSFSSTMAANLEVTDDSINGVSLVVKGSGGAIAWTSTGLTLSPVYAAAMGVNGVLNYSGGINIGAGDAFVVGVASDVNAGYFHDSGVTNLTGTSTNLAYMMVKVGNDTNTSTTAGVTAAYGTVNLSYGVFSARVADSTQSFSQFNLSNSSTLTFYGSIFKASTVNFKDATDTLLLTQTSAGKYGFNGVMTGFQSGDAIGLVTTVSNPITPTSVQFNAVTGELTVYSGTQNIGQIAISGNYFASGFSLATTSTRTPITNYGAEYDITYNSANAAVTTLASLTVAAATLTALAATNENVQTTATVGGELDVDSTGAGGSELLVGGGLTVNSGGKLEIGNAADTLGSLVIAATLSNSGTITLAGGAMLNVASAAGTGQLGVLTGNVSLTGNAALTFGSGGLTTIAGDLSLSGAQATLGIKNNSSADAALGTVTTVATGGVLDLESGNIASTNQALTNSGVIDIDANGGSGGAYLNVNNLLTNSGALNIGNGSLQVSDGVSANQLVNSASGVITLAQTLVGFANLNVTGSFADNYGMIQGTGSITDSSPTAFAFVNHLGGTLLAGAAQNLSVNWANITNNGAIDISSGIVNISDASNSSTLTDGFTGEIKLTSGSAGLAELAVAGSLDNYGTIDGGGQILATSGTSSLINGVTAFISATPSSNGLFLDNWGMITNYGTLYANGGNLQINGDVAGTGNLTANGSTLAVSGAVSQSSIWTFEATNGGAINISGNLSETAGATLGGQIRADGGDVHISGAVTGQLLAFISNNGKIEIGGAINDLGGYFSFTSGGTLVIDDLAHVQNGSQTQDFNTNIGFFGYGDTIELSTSGLGGYGAVTGIAAGAYNVSSNTTQISLMDGQNAVGTLTFNGDYVASNFVLTSDPTNGVVKLTAQASAAGMSQAIDGYIKNATVTQGSVTTQTDAFGRYSLPAGGSGEQVLTGGVDSSTQLPFLGTLSAPSDYTVITALSTLVDAQLAQNALLTQFQAEQNVLTAFGIDQGIQLKTLDPVGGTLNGVVGAAKVFAVNAQILDSVNMLGSALAGASGNGPAATNAVINALAAEVAGGQSPDLTNQADVLNLLDLAGQLLGANGQTISIATAQQIATIVAASNDTFSNFVQTIQSGASPVGAIASVSAAERVAQGNTTTALADLSNIGATFNAYTGNALTTSVTTAQTQVVTPNVACYCAGTLILTDHGEVAVETLAIGDRVLTLSGEARPIKWIGMRSYDGRFVRGNRDVLPIRVRAGALADSVPSRDLWLSPHHALHLQGVLIEAKDLVNGVSIVQAETIERVDYFHIELFSHDVIFAEGAEAETFIDNDSRAMFENVAEFFAIYPKTEGKRRGKPFAPRRDEGFEIEAARQKIATHAGIFSTASSGELRGWVEGMSSDALWGWAQDTGNSLNPACLHVYADGCVIGRVLANRFRADLRDAGLGCGRHAFRFEAPKGVDLSTVHVELRRASDGAALSCPKKCAA